VHDSYLGNVAFRTKRMRGAVRMPSMNIEDIGNVGDLGSWLRQTLDIEHPIAGHAKLRQGLAASGKRTLQRLAPPHDRTDIQYRVLD
jgi:hypothetical protein